MENKEISQSVVEAKSEAKAGTDQQPYRECVIHRHCFTFYALFSALEEPF